MLPSHRLLFHHLTKKKNVQEKKKQCLHLFFSVLVLLFWALGHGL